MKKRVQSSRSVRPWGFFILRLLLSGFRDNRGQSCCFDPRLGPPSGRQAGSFKKKICQVTAFAIVILITLTGWSLAQFQSADFDPMKRRQQGILTGMPFMSNLAPRTFVDDLVRKLFLAKHPTRIISLAPSITEILFALGLND